MESKPKSKAGIVIAIVALSLVVLGAVFAWVYFFTDIFKSPQDLFYQYVGKINKSETDYGYQELLEDLKTVKTKSYTEKASMGVEVKSTGYLTKSAQSTFDEINKLKLNFEAKSNPTNKKAEYSIGLDYGNKNVTAVKFVKDKDVYGIKSDLIDSKYLAIENNNLKDLGKKFGISTSAIPDKIEMLDIYDLLYVSKEDQERIAKTYGDVLKNSVPAQNYSKAGNVVKTINGQDKVTTAYSLKLTEKDVITVIGKLLQAARDDEATLNLVVDKVNKILNESFIVKTYLNQTPTLRNGLSTINNLKKDDLEKTLDSALENLRKQVDSASTDATTEMIVYVSEGKTTRLEVKVNDETVYAIDYFTVDGKDHIVWYAQNYSSSYNYYTNLYKYNFNSSAKSNELMKVMEMEYKIEKTGDQKKVEGTMSSNAQGQELKTSFDVLSKGKTGEGKNENIAKVVMETSGVSIAFTMEASIDYTEDVKIDDLNSTNANIINDMTKEQIEKLFNSISTTYQKQINELSKQFNLSATKTPTLTIKK